MCITINKKIGREQPKPKRAKEDIPVYKVLNRYGGSPCYPLKINKVEQIWQRGYIYSESNPFDTQGYVHKRRELFYVQGRCLYSYATRSAAKDNFGHVSNYFKIRRMYIPKGALYYEGRYGVIVSDKLWFA